MTHLLPFSSKALSEPREIFTHDHAPTFSAPGHRRTNFWFDPLLDNCLNPARGETLWFEKNKWIQIPGYTDPFKVLGELEITLSPIAAFSDCLKINDGFGLYNDDMIDEETMSEITLYTPILEAPIGEKFQEATILLLDHLLKKSGLQKTMSFLNNLEMISLSKGVHRFYINVKKDQNNFTKALLEYGYILTGSFHHLKNNKYEQRLYKEIPGPALYPDAPIDMPDCSWVPEKDDSEDLPPAKFGIFIRKNGYVRGGLFGEIHTENVFIPHADIDLFWIDSTIRGTGFGTKVMNFAFKHLKQRGAQVAELSTMDYQAPLFYEKMGFSRIHTDPKIVKSRDGKLNNSYIYRKVL